MKCYKYWRMFYCTTCDKVEYHRVMQLWLTHRWCEYYRCTCGAIEDKVMADILLPQERTVPTRLHIKISPRYIKASRRYQGVQCE